MLNGSGSVPGWRLSRSLGSSLAGSGLLWCCGYVAEREVCLEIFHWLAVDFRIGVDEIVERIAFLIGGEADVAAVGKENAVNVVSAEEIIVLGGIFPGFRGVYG